MLHIICIIGTCTWTYHEDGEGFCWISDNSLSFIFPSVCHHQHLLYHSNRSCQHQLLIAKASTYYTNPDSSSLLAKLIQYKNNHDGSGY